MAVVPTSSSFYNHEPQSSLFLNDGGNAAVYTSFGCDNLSMFGSTAGMSWSDPYQACSSSSYTPAAIFSGLSIPAGVSSLSDEPQLVYPTGEDILLGGDYEFLQQLHAGCNQPVMNPHLVDNLKNMVTSHESPELGYFQHQHQHLDHYSHRHNVHTTEPGLISQGNMFMEQQLLADSGQMPPSDGSLTSPEITVVAVESDPLEKHEPPPLNMKRLEKLENPAENNIEAAEVTVDLIQNRRPFRCGQEGCNKTFKNPQTMKMHHKTHYTDGTATSREGHAALPTLTPSLKAGQNKKIPSRCPKCRKTFVGLYELRRHYGRKHSEGEKPFGCRKCGKRFYIEVDLRDHEKLCGEPIECKCGLKFAFKCNLVAHKKAHPACQDNNSNQQPGPATNVSSYNNQSTLTSDVQDSNASRGSSSSSPPLPIIRGTKRHRSVEVEASTISCCSSSITSQRYNMSGYSSTPPAPDFSCLPEVSTLKAARYDFAGLQYSTTGSSFWASNMHYPSVCFSTSLPVPASTTNMYSTPVLGCHVGLQDQLGSQVHSLKPAPQVGPFSSTESNSGLEFHMLNSLSAQLHGAMVRLH